MYVDYRKSDVGPQIKADICIIGAGAAGISIAREFIGTDIRVCLLEGGGLKYDDASQALYAGRSTGVHTEPGPGGCRLRYFGGTTNHWGRRCARLTKMDFGSRPWVPFSGWPIGENEVAEYYPGAESVCRLRPHSYELSDQAGTEKMDKRFHQDKLVYRFRQVGPLPSSFGEMYGQALRAAQNVRVYFHANAIGIEVGRDRSNVHRISLRTLDGKEGAVSARYFVIACGALENARLLLASNNVFGDGVGNQHDAVGRFFMQHPHSIVAEASVGNLLSLGNMLARRHDKGADLIPCICPSDMVQTQMEILNYAAQVNVDRDPKSGYEAWKKMITSLKKGRWPDDFSNKIKDIVTGLDEVGTALYRRYALGMRYPYIKRVRLHAFSEQAPNPDSRVTLNSEIDELGLNRITVDWRLTELDKRTIQYSTKLIGEEFGRLGVGRIKIHDWLLNKEKEPSWPDPLWGGCHHMGTTRMSDNPRRGVVDRDCAVHGVDNLYMAGSSVFSTSGYANPTLTIVALSLRLADHLKERMRNRESIGM